MSSSDMEGLSGDSESEATEDSHNTTSTSSENGTSKKLEAGGSPSPLARAGHGQPKTSLGQAKSVPIPSAVSSMPGGGDKGSAEDRATSGSMPGGANRRKESNPNPTTSSSSSMFNPFDAIGKAVGSGVNIVGNATKAVGTGVVQGTKAVGTGVVKGTQAVGSGVVSAAGTVGDGVVSGVAAVSNVVVETGEAVGSAAVSGVTAVGQATKRTATSVSKSVDDSTTWVREKRRSVLLHAKPYKQHRVEEGETLAIIAAKYKTTVEDIVTLNKEAFTDSSELVAGTKIKVSVREKRKSSKQQSADFLTNLSSAFADMDEGQLDVEQVNTRCIIMSNVEEGPEIVTPGYIILERDCLILSWGVDTILNIDIEFIQKVSLLFGDDEMSGFSGGIPTGHNPPDPENQSDSFSETAIGGHSFSEADVFPVWEEKPELEDSHSSIGTEDTSPRPKEENSDDMAGSLKNTGSFEESFPMGSNHSLGRSKSEDKTALGLEEDERLLGRRRSRRRTASKDRRQSLLFEDTMSTYLILQVDKNSKDEWNGCTIRETEGSPLNSQEAFFLMRVPNESVVKLFSVFNRNYSEVYGSCELDSLSGLRLITMDSLQSGAGDAKIATVLARKGSEDNRDFILPNMTHDSEVLEPADIDALLHHLPPRVENHTWNLAFSTERDGFALSTLYRKMAEIESPVLIAIMDTSEHIFGGLLSEAPQITDNFAGTGECWLFSFPEDETLSIQVYQWTKKNDHFIKGCSTSLAIGAGKGQFGIWFDEDLNHGRSQTCSTFGNPPLTPSEDFRVKCMEIWSFYCSSDS